MFGDLWHISRVVFCNHWDKETSLLISKHVIKYNDGIQEKAYCLKSIKITYFNEVTFTNPFIQVQNVYEWHVKYTITLT